MDIFAHDIGKVIRVHVNEDLTNASSSTLAVINPRTGKRDEYASDSIDTSLRYVEFTKSGDRFNAGGTWRLELSVVFSDGDDLHGRGQIEIGDPL